MQAFRNLVKGWLGKSILIAVAVLFAFLGAEGIFSVLEQPDPPATVNGEDITDIMVQREVELERRRMLQRMGQNADPSSIDAAKLKPKAIEALVQSEVMRQSSEDDELYASKATITRKIQSVPNFQVDGEFSEELFERHARNLGFSPFQLFAEVGKEVVQMQYIVGLGASAFVSEQELKELVALQNQKRDVAVATITNDIFKDDIEVTDEQIEKHYKNNQVSYMTPEQATAEYLEINTEDFVADVDVTDADVKKEYEDEVNRLKNNEERRASHILVEISDTVDDDAAKAKIDDLKKQLDDGADFAELAKEHSDDIGSKETGGDLDFAAKGAYLPEFEEALFALEENAISDVVQTEYGYHIIKLTEIRTPEIPAFDDQKEELRTKVATRLAEEVFYDKLEEVRTLAFESSDLQTSAEFLGKELQTSPWLKKRGNSGVFSNQKVVDALYSDEVLLDDLNSDVIEISSGKAIVLHVKDHKPESVKPLAEVKAQIKTKLENQFLADKAEEAGRAIVAKLKAGDSTNTVLANYETVSWDVKEGVERRSPDLGFQVAQEAFKLPKPAEGEKSVGGVKVRDGFTVIVVSKVEPGTYELSNNEAKQMKQYLASQVGQADYQNYIEFRKQSSDVEVN